MFQMCGYIRYKTANKKRRNLKVANHIIHSTSQDLTETTLVIKDNALFVEFPVVFVPVSTLDQTCNSFYSWISIVTPSALVVHKSRPLLNTRVRNYIVDWEWAEVVDNEDFYFTRFFLKFTITP